MIKFRRTYWQTEVSQALPSPSSPHGNFERFLNFSILAVISGSDHLHHEVPVGHGEIPHKAIFEEHIRNHIEGMSGLMIMLTVPYEAVLELLVYLSRVTRMLNNYACVSLCC